MNVLLMVGIAPFSWRWGLVRRKAAVKTVWSLGPIRIALHHLGASA